MTEKKPDKIFSADILVPVTSPPIFDGAVLVHCGLILHFGRRSDVIDFARANGHTFSETHYDGVLTPGLVNAHTHLQYSGMSEIGQQRYKGMEEWAQAFNKVYNALAADEGFDEWGVWADLGARLMLETGTTAAADIVTDDSAIGSLHNSGLKGICYREAMNITNEEWAEGGREKLLSAVRMIPVPPAAGISPHTPYSLDRLPLKKIPSLAHEHGYRIHIHVGETFMENELSGEFDPDDFRTGFRTYDFRQMRLDGEKISASKYLDRLGFFDDAACHIAHGVYINEEDRVILRRQNVAVALCPRSNDVIGVGEAPVRAYIEEGNAIAIGTDSLSSAPSMNLLDDAAMLCKIAIRQGYKDKDIHKRIFYAATTGGAKALGLDKGSGRIGCIEKEAAADFAVFKIAGAGNLSSGAARGASENQIYAQLTEGKPDTVATILNGRQCTGHVPSASPK
jgi:cytosine/adenosine deaminase-related metal-dependent hydrolase